MIVEALQFYVSDFLTWFAITLGLAIIVGTSRK